MLFRSEKSNLSEETIKETLSNLQNVYPSAVLSVVLRQLAEILDEKYEDHISNSETLYVVSKVNGKIEAIDSNLIKNYKHFAAFRTMEDAKKACKWLKKQFREMYK